MTHSELVEVARRWLLKPWRSSNYEDRGRGNHGSCSVVITDMTTSAWETPDAIGWHSGYSTLVECKASRSDFLADRKKHHRVHPQMGLGIFRYYMAPKGMVTQDELPDRWGLIEVSEKGKTRVVRPSDNFQCHDRGEVQMLLSLLCRLKVDTGEHVAVRVFYMKSTGKPRATATFNEDGEGTPPCACLMTDYCSDVDGTCDYAAAGNFDDCDRYEWPPKPGMEPHRCTCGVELEPGQLRCDDCKTPLFDDEEGTDG